MIFRSYAYWIKYLFDYKARKRKIPIIKKITEVETYGVCTPYQIKQYDYKISPAKWYAWFYKPLGGCILCNTQWIYTGVFLAFYLPIPLREALTLFLLGSGTNYIWIEIISKVK